MSKTIFISVPDQPDRDELIASIGNAASTVSGRLNEHVDVFRPSLPVQSPASTTLMEAIQRADLVLADVTGRSPNVLLEVGMAHSLRRPLLLLARDPADVPTSFTDTVVLIAQTRSPAFLASRLADMMVSLLEGRSTVAEQPKAASIFLSYSHADAEYLDRILVHLRPLERAGFIALWSDTKLRPGDHWRKEIQDAIDRARVAILLVSADFMASEFIATNELPRLLKAAEDRGTRILPVILKPSRFARHSTLSRFHPVNDPKTPVIQMTEADREGLYARLAELIESDMGGVD